MTNRRDQLVTGILGVALTATFAALIYVPYQRRIARLEAHTNDYRQELLKQTNQVAQVNDLELQVVQARQQLADFATQIPPTPSVGEFIEQVTQLAASQRIVDPHIEPLRPARGDQVWALPIRLTFAGDFAAVYGFLSGIEMLPRLARLTETTIPP